MKVTVQTDDYNNVISFFENDNDEKQEGIHLTVSDTFFNENKGKDFKIVDGELVVNTIKEQISLKENQITEAKQYLLDTDYVVIKINEHQLQDKPIEPLLIKYSVELAEREAKRELINTLEQEIINLKI